LSKHVLMKILYAVQATGNGHISRAMQLLPQLEQYGTVDLFLSGNNASLQLNGNVKFRSKGLSLYYTKCGGLSYSGMIWKNNIVRAMKEARDLPVQSYDIVINDFEFITAESCRIHKKESIHLGHQASFLSDKTPRPAIKSKVGELIYKHYCKTSHHLGFHFEKYDDFILPPVVKNEIIAGENCDLGHVTVYLPSYQRHCIETHFRYHKDIVFHWFLAGIKKPVREGNIIFYPIHNSLFTQSLLSCHGLITGGGFETPSEALYLGKKLLCIPIRDHYEQKCNGAALSQMGVITLPDADSPDFFLQIQNWLDRAPIIRLKEVNNIEETILKAFAQIKSTIETRVA